MIKREFKIVGISSFILGVIMAMILFPKTDYKTIYKTEIKTETDTVYVSYRDTIYIPKTKIKTEYIRDTILINFKPQIKRFETFIPFEHGNTKVSGEVLGEVLKMTAINDYSIPIVTNKITETKTEKIVMKPKGIYVGAGINSMLQPAAKVSVLDNKYLFQYQYQPVTKVHSLGISKKLF
jgi:hypothetical protein